MKSATLLLALAVLLPRPAAGEVTRSAPDALEARQRAEIAASPARVFREIVRVDRWWSDVHTWSGSSRNLRLTPEAGGCFCESWPGGSAEHGRVVQVRRDELLRLDAALGPFQDMAVTGRLTFALEPAEQATTVTLTYRISGDSTHGLDKIAPQVDAVIGELLGRLERLVETGKPD